MKELIGINFILYAFIFIAIIWSEDLTIKNCIKMWLMCCLLITLLTTGVYLILF